MLDMKFVRENPEIVKENIRKKFPPFLSGVLTSDRLGPKSDNEKSCYTDATITDTKDSVSDLMLPCNSSDSSD